MSDLKPCPFCGGKAERIELTDDQNFGGSCITCTECDACSRVLFGEKEGLSDLWNNRAGSRAMSDLERRIVTHLKTVEGSTAWAMRNAVDALPKDISKALQRLKRKGFVSNSRDQSTYWRIWSKGDE